MGYNLWSNNFYSEILLCFWYNLVDIDYIAKYKVSVFM